jgi:hypothetical protein
VALFNIQVVCTDAQEHRRRVETRTGDIPGLTPPTWQSVSTHEYERWGQPVLTLDTASVTATEAVASIIAHTAMP